jgi:hypothetical protein
MLFHERSTSILIQRSVVKFDVRGVQRETEIFLVMTSFLN